MGKYLKKFGSHSDYITFIGGGGDTPFLRPNVSYCVDGNDTHYNPITTKLIITYNVTDATNPTRLYYYEYDEQYPQWSVLGANMFDVINIDGVDVEPSTTDATQGQYQLSQGEHTVTYTLKNSNRISFMAFVMCSGITSAVIPDSVQYIDGSAFYNCSNLSSLTIGSGFRGFADGAFSECNNLTTITFHCKNVGTWFRGLQIENVVLGSEVETIADGAFCGCESINSTDRATIEAINEDAFCELFCVMLTFPQNAEKAILGESGAYAYEFDNGTEIPMSEIITEESN